MVACCEDRDCAEAGTRDFEGSLLCAAHYDEALDVLSRHEAECERSYDRWAENGYSWS